MASITRDFDGDEFRFYMDEEGHLWPHAGDVCRKRDVQGARQAVSRLKDSQKLFVYITDVNGWPHHTWFLSPQGLYKLAWTSRKPEAEAFRLGSRCD
jgi:prophage antirepressor-like protein